MTPDAGARWSHERQSRAALAAAIAMMFIWGVNFGVTKYVLGALGVGRFCSSAFCRVAARLPAAGDRLPAPPAEILAAARGPAEVRDLRRDRPHAARRHRHLGDQPVDRVLFRARADQRPAVDAADPRRSSASRSCARAS
jgi:hypothetical protein